MPRFMPRCVFREGRGSEEFPLTLQKIWLSGPDSTSDRVEENKVRGYCLWAGAVVLALYGKLRDNPC